MVQQNVLGAILSLLWGQHTEKLFLSSQKHANCIFVFQKYVKKRTNWRLDLWDKIDCKRLVFNHETAKFDQLELIILEIKIKRRNMSRQEKHTCNYFCPLARNQKTSRVFPELPRKAAFLQLLKSSCKRFKSSSKWNNFRLRIIRL